MIDHRGISEILPHRYPMLLVDRVIAMVPGESLVAIKAVTCNEPWFQAGGDTFLRGDTFPNVLLVESWCQAAGVLAAHERPNPDVCAGNVMLFGGISGVRFHRPVGPGDVVEHRVRLIRALSDVSIFEGESLVGELTVMEVERIIMAQRPAESLSPPGHYGATHSHDVDKNGQHKLEEVGNAR